MSAGTAILRLEAVLVTALKTVLGLVLLGMVAVNLLNAAARYSGITLFTGADELLVFAMIFVVMLGAVLAVRDRDHLTIDLVPQRFSDRGRQRLLAGTNLVGALVCGFVAVHSLTYVERIGALGQISMGLGVPMVVPHLFITTGLWGIAAVFALLALIDLYNASAAK